MSKKRSETEYFLLLHLSQDGPFLLTGKPNIIYSCNILYGDIVDIVVRKYTAILLKTDF